MSYFQNSFAFLRKANSFQREQIACSLPHKELRWTIFERCHARKKYQHSCTDSFLRPSNPPALISRSLFFRCRRRQPLSPMCWEGFAKLMQRDVLFEPTHLFVGKFLTEGDAWAKQTLLISLPARKQHMMLRIFHLPIIMIQEQPQRNLLNVLQHSEKHPQHQNNKSCCAGLSVENELVTQKNHDHDSPKRPSSFFSANPLRDEIFSEFRVKWMFVLEGGR